MRQRAGDGDARPADAVALTSCTGTSSSTHAGCSAVAIVGGSIPTASLTMEHSTRRKLAIAGVSSHGACRSSRRLCWGNNCQSSSDSLMPHLSSLNRTAMGMYVRSASSSDSNANRQASSVREWPAPLRVDRASKTTPDERASRGGWSISAFFGPDSYANRRCLKVTVSLKSATVPIRRMLAHVPL